MFLFLARWSHRFFYVMRLFFWGFHTQPKCTDREKVFFLGESGRNEVAVFPSVLQSVSFGAASTTE